MNSENTASNVRELTDSSDSPSLRHMSHETAIPSIAQQFAAHIYSVMFRRTPTTLATSADLLASMASLELTRFSLLNVVTRITCRLDVFVVQSCDSLSRSLDHFEERTRHLTEQLLQASDGTLLLLPLRAETSSPSAPTIAAGAPGLIALHSEAPLYQARLPLTPTFEALFISLPTPCPQVGPQVFRFPRSEQDAITVQCRTTNNSPDHLLARVYAPSQVLRVVDLQLMPDVQRRAAANDTQTLRCDVRRESESLMLHPSSPRTYAGRSAGTHYQWCHSDGQLGVLAVTNAELHDDSAGERSRLCGLTAQGDDSERYESEHATVHMRSIRESTSAQLNDLSDTGEELTAKLDRRDVDAFMRHNDRENG